MATGVGGKRRGRRERRQGEYHTAVRQPYLPAHGVGHGQGVESSSRRGVAWRVRLYCRFNASAYTKRSRWGLSRNCSCFGAALGTAAVVQGLHTPPLRNARRVEAVVAAEEELLTPRRRRLSTDTPRPISIV